MPNVSLNGVDFTANVITEPERFHILKGRACNAENEIVITEFIASDMSLEIGDTVTVGTNSGNGNYVISGIYSCANDMGKNIGMSREGYLKIARDHPNLWCYHYFLKDPDCKYDITAELENLYGGDIHVHENTWPGLFGIISAMRGLTAFMYAAVIVFILIVTVMTSGKIMSSEQRDLGILKSIGFTNLQLEINFAMRFMLTAFIGAIIGIIFAATVTDSVVSAIMKLAGISNFASFPNAFEVIFPALTVIFLFGIFGFISAGKIKKVRPYNFNFGINILKGYDHYERKLLRSAAICVVLSMLFAGCSQTENNSADTTSADLESTSAAELQTENTSEVGENSTSENILNVTFGHGGKPFEMKMENNDTANAIVNYVGTADWNLPIYHYDDYEGWEAMQYYDIPSRYDIPDDSESISAEKGGDVYYSHPNRIILFYHDAEIEGEYTKIGTIEYTDEFVKAVEGNPVLEGWGNKIVSVSPTK